MISVGIGFGIYSLKLKITNIITIFCICLFPLIGEISHLLPGYKKGEVVLKVYDKMNSRISIYYSPF